MVDAGFDPYFGRRLTRELQARGLTEIGGEGRSLVITADHPGAPFYRLSLASVRDVLIEQERATAADIDETLAQMDSGDGIILSPVMVAAWGRAAA